MRAASTIGGVGRQAAAGDGDDNDRKSSATEAARQRARLESPDGQRLLREYLAARIDPKARAEQEAYLRQLEQDADAASAAVVGGGTIPEGKALVWPRTEGFVAKARRVRVRARQQEQGETEEEEEQKVFLNVVVSERMPPPALGEGGRVWHCPNALGPARVEEDSAGHPAIAYDFLVHPEAAADERLRVTLMETAAEAVARMEAGKGKGKSEWRLRDSFFVLRNRTYMGARPTPPAMLIDRAALVPEPHPPQQPPSTKTAAAAAASKAQTPASPATSAAPAAPPADAAARQRAAAATTTTITPRYTITERQHHLSSGSQQQQPHGGKGAAAAGGSSTSTSSSLLSAVPSALAAGSLRRQPPPRQRPGELVLRVQLPSVASAAALALDLAERELILESSSSSPSSSKSNTPPQYALRLRLPYPVRVGRESASFSRKRAELTVTLPVCPPPPESPSPPATEEAAETNADGGDALRSAAREEPEQEQEQQQRPPAADVNPHARWVEGGGGGGDRLVLDPMAVGEGRAKAQQAQAPAQQAQAQGAAQKEEQQQRKEEEAAVVASSYVTPAYRVEQRPGCFSLIFDAPGVDPGSVEAAWANDDGAADGTGATMTLVFHGGKSAEERRHYYRLRLRLWGRVDPQGCRVDVASRNVLVVVRKAKEKEAGAGWWPRFEAEGEGAAGGGGGKQEAGAPLLKPALENSHVFELEE